MDPGVALHGAALAITPYTKGKFQLSQREVETSRALSCVRIHVERAIGRIHVERAIGRIKRYRILQSTLPISLIKRPYETDYSTIDKILIVCAALSNLHPPLIYRAIGSSSGMERTKAVMTEAAQRLSVSARFGAKR